jgi:hypothetical protein
MKYYKDSPEAVARRNAIRVIGERMVGGTGVFASMTPEGRADIRKASTQLYNAGKTAAKAEEYMAQSTAGFVYILCNPAWPNAVKIGRACNPKARLSSYNTGCPDRAYYIHRAVYFEDCVTAENLAHVYFDDRRLSGEWFGLDASEAWSLLTKLKEKEDVECFTTDCAA